MTTEEAKKHLSIVVADYLATVDGSYTSVPHLDSIEDIAELVEHFSDWLDSKLLKT